MPAVAPNIDAAFDRVEDFLAVQGPAVGIEAVNLLQEAVGVDAQTRVRIGERIATLDDAGHPSAAGSVLLGVIVGLFAAHGACR
jgi:hypothetical protein